MKDFELIEQLKAIVANRKYVPSRKLHNRAETLLQQKYEVTDKKFDATLKKIIKAFDAVTLTCSARFKVKLDTIEFILGE